MKLSLLHKLLKNELGIDFFKSQIESEMEEYTQKLKSKARSIPIYIEDDLSWYFVTSDLIQLCQYYLDNHLSAVDVYYLADCLTLSESVSFESEELREFVEEMTDPVINGILTKERVVSIIGSLQ
jgi:hypothetical protein